MQKHDFVSLTRIYSVHVKSRQLVTNFWNIRHFPIILLPQRNVTFLAEQIANRQICSREVHRGEGTWKVHQTLQTGRLMVDINNPVRAELSNTFRELTFSLCSSNGGTAPFGPICQKASLVGDCQSTAQPSRDKATNKREAVVWVHETTNSCAHYKYMQIVPLLYVVWTLSMRVWEMLRAFVCGLFFCLRVWCVTKWKWLWGACTEPNAAKSLLHAHSKFVSGLRFFMSLWVLFKCTGPTLCKERQRRRDVKSAEGVSWGCELVKSWTPEVSSGKWTAWMLERQSKLILISFLFLPPHRLYCHRSVMVVETQ